MFGDNPIRKIEREVQPDGRIAVQEIFYTVQGEGPFAGMAAPFVRLAGCHLACTFCDTEFESGINNRLTPSEITRTCSEMLEPIMRRGGGVANNYRPLVVLTGGEPLRQEIGPLIDMLNAAGLHVQIETAGNLWRDSIQQPLNRKGLTVVCSPKTTIHPRFMGYCHDFKYIIKAGEISLEDGLPNKGTQKNSKPPARPAATNAKQPTIWVSPCDEYDEEKNKANRDICAHLALRYGYRVSLQTHKILGVA